MQATQNNAMLAGTTAVAGGASCPFAYRLTSLLTLLPILVLLVLIILPTMGAGSA